jgi:alkylation response protein AidB-like acyl-CoA dehydrogenase
VSGGPPDSPDLPANGEPRDGSGLSDGSGLPDRSDLPNGPDLPASGGPPVSEFRRLLARELPAAWAEAAQAGDADQLARFAAGPDGARAVRTVAAAGWLTPEWPAEYGGRGLRPDDALEVRRELRRWQIGDVSSAIGTSWVGPAILQFGTPAAKARLLPPIARNESLWCQLFSEPEAGSDLAAVRTRAVRTKAVRAGAVRAGSGEDGAEWILDGAKIWTSRANIASWGLALARTDPAVPKHAGLSCFCVPMDAPGVQIRPIRQMTGDSEFFEVRLDGCAVSEELLLGAPGQGWEIVRAVLAFERRAGSGVGAAPPGSVVGRGIEELIEHYRGRLDPVRADEVARLYIESQLIEFNNRRIAAERAGGSRSPAITAPFNKVMQAEHTQRLQQMFLDAGGLGAVAADPDDEWAARNSWSFLRVQAKTIAGGTSEVLRNQIAERALGLPRDNDPSRSVPWQDFLAGLAGGGAPGDRAPGDGTPERVPGDRAPGDSEPGGGGAA